jgi:hypothetical protein
MKREGPTEHKVENVNKRYEFNSQDMLIKGR